MITIQLNEKVAPWIEIPIVRTVIVGDDKF